MSDETSELPADHPIRWVVWEWQNDRSVFLMWVGVALLILTLIMRVSTIGFILASGYGAASTLKYFLWMRMVKNAKTET